MVCLNNSQKNQKKMHKDNKQNSLLGSYHTTPQFRLHNILKIRDFYKLKIALHVFQNRELVLPKAATVKRPV